jgi:3-deoxy-manno-octulosonate cytidylyltransferase (CMP-KDO synthetase)
MSIVGIIPARYASTRFPGKPLADIAGRPMIHHVYERACRSTLLEEVIVATDDQRIFDTVIGFGGEAIMTDPNHQTGTDRLAEVAKHLSAVNIFVNIQGDEPLISHEAIDAVAGALQKDTSVPMSSAMTPLTDMMGLWNQNVVKVVTDLQGYALYFSRVPIPTPPDESADPAPWKRHIGLYAYRRDFLLTFVGLPRSPLEKIESLEQLRVLEHGYRIKMVELDDAHSIGVDTPEDLQRVKEMLAQQLAATENA